MLQPGNGGQLMGRFDLRRAAAWNSYAVVYQRTPTHHEKWIYSGAKTFQHRQVWQMRRRTTVNPSSARHTGSKALTGVFSCYARRVKSAPRALLRMARTAFPIIVLRVADGECEVQKLLACARDDESYGWSSQTSLGDMHQHKSFSWCEWAHTSFSLPVMLFISAAHTGKYRVSGLNFTLRLLSGITAEKWSTSYIKDHQLFYARVFTFQ